MIREGNSASKLVDLIKTIGHNTDVVIEFGTVTAAPPSLRVKVDGMKIELEADDVVVAESLTDHTREISITIGSGSASTMVVKAALKVGERVIMAQIHDGQTYVILDRIGGVA